MSSMHKGFIPSIFMHTHVRVHVTITEIILRTYVYAQLPLIPLLEILVAHTCPTLAKQTPGSFSQIPNET